MKKSYVSPEIQIKNVFCSMLQASGIDAQSLFDNVKPDKFGVYER